MEKISLDRERENVLWWVAREQAEEDMLCWRMLENNRIEGILSFDYYYVDDGLCFQYPYSGMQIVKEYLAEKQADCRTAQFLCKEVLRIVERGSEYLLRQDGFLVDPEWIVWNRLEKKLWLCYLPGRKESIKGSFTTLVEYLLQHIDHKDPKAVAFMYGLYDYVTSGNFVVGDVLEYIQSGHEKLSDNSEKKEMHTKEVQIPVAEKEKKEGRFYMARSNVGQYPFITNCPDKYFIDTGEIVVGRHPESGVYLPFATVSLQHAVLFCEEDSLWIMDMDSHNGTFLNSNKISAYIKTKCNAEDVLTFADISFCLKKIGVSEKPRGSPDTLS